MAQTDSAAAQACVINAYPVFFSIFLFLFSTFAIGFYYYAENEQIAQ